MSVPRLLAAGAVALVVTHWLRLLPLGYAAPGATRWEDFADLVTPFVVAGPALAVLARTGASRTTWAVALTASTAFVQGHGVHLSANSISYARGDAAPTYLWDEVVGHHLWFGGLALLVAVVAREVRPLPLPAGPLAYALAAAVGVTWGVNTIEGGAVPFGATLTAALVVLGLRDVRTPTGRLLAVTFTVSLLLLAAYGAWQGGYPQPSELGWL